MAFLSISSLTFCAYCVHYSSTLIFIIEETITIFTLLLIESVHFASRTPCVVRESIMT